MAHTERLEMIRIWLRKKITVKLFCEVKVMCMCVFLRVCEFTTCQCRKILMNKFANAKCLDVITRWPSTENPKRIIVAMYVSHIFGRKISISHNTDVKKCCVGIFGDDQTLVDDKKKIRIEFCYCVYRKHFQANLWCEFTRYQYRSIPI